MAAQTFPLTIEMAVSNGLIDRFRFFPCAVRLLAGTSVVLGSGVLLSPRWVLTASHLFRLRQDIVRVQDSGSRQTVRAKAVYWRSGESCQLGQQAWPAEANNRGGATDELLLVELDGDMDAGQYAAVFNDEGPEEVADGQLFMAGFGADDQGREDRKLRYASLSYKGDCEGRGAAISNASALPSNGMARKDDSGAPVFMIRTLPKLVRVIVGIHSSRCRGHSCNLDGVGPQQEVARYIRIGAADREWVRSTMGNPAEAVIVKPPMLQTRSVDPRLFCLRDQHCCLTYNAVNDLDGKSYTMGNASGTGTVLRVNDQASIVLDGSGVRWLEIRRCGAERIRWRVALAPYEIKTGETHCLLGTLAVAPTHADTAYNGTEFYVFQRADTGSTVSADSFLHIEVFLPTSSHAKPSAEAIGEACASCDEMEWNSPLCSELVDEPLPYPGDDDQDDESDGYEN